MEWEDIVSGVRGVLGDVASYELARRDAELTRQLALGQNGGLYIRGQPAGKVVVSTLTSVLPLLILVGLGVVVYRLAR